MASKSKKFYVVWVGHNPGVYNSWDECQAQVKGFEGARYKAFSNESQAISAFRGNMWDYLKKPSKQPQLTSDQSAFEEKKSEKRHQYIAESVSVDAACGGNPGIMEYQGVYTKNGRRIFYAGPFPDGTNNVGEFLAIVHALALLKSKKKTLPIYSDSETAIVWVRNKHANTKLKPTNANAQLFELIQRAEKWLKTNTWNIPVLKWETEWWGEIPADFGRK